MKSRHDDRDVRAFMRQPFIHRNLRREIADSQIVEGGCYKFTSRSPWEERNANIYLKKRRKMEIAEASTQHSLLTLKSDVTDQSETAMELVEDVSGSEGTVDGATGGRERNEIAISNTAAGNGELDSKAAKHWYKVNFDPDSMNAGAISMEIDYAKDRAALPANKEPVTILTKELIVTIQNCGNVVQGDNTTTVIQRNDCNHCKCQQPPLATSSSCGAVVSDGPTNVGQLRTPSTSIKSDQRNRQRPKRKPGKKANQQNGVKFSEVSKVRKRLYFGGLEMATKDLVRALDSLEYGCHEDSVAVEHLINWCKNAISYLFRECNEQENYEQIKDILETAKAVVEKDFEKCINNIMEALKLSEGDLKEAMAIAADVRFVLAEYYSIKNKRRLALEQLKMIQWNSCPEEQKGRILLKTGETSALIAQECGTGEEGKSSCEAVMAETEKHFEEALQNCSGKMLTRRDQQAIKDACHIGMAKLLLRTDRPLTSEGPAPSKEDLIKAKEHIDHLEMRTAHLSPLMESQYFLLKTYYQYFLDNFDCARSTAIKAKGRAEEWHIERDRELATAAISVLSEKLPEKCETDDSPHSFTEIMGDWESSSADNEDSDCDDTLNLTDSDSDF